MCERDDCLRRAKKKMSGPGYISIDKTYCGLALGGGRYGCMGRGLHEVFCARMRDSGEGGTGVALAWEHFVDAGQHDGGLNGRHHSGGRWVLLWGELLYGGKRTGPGLGERKNGRR